MKAKLADLKREKEKRQREAHGDERDRFIVSSGEFIADFVPPDYLVKGIVQFRFLYGLTGKTGAGKSAVLLLLAALVALDRSIADRVVKQARVLYLAGENPTDIRMRWLAMAERMGFDAKTIEVHFVPGVFTISTMFTRVADEVRKLDGVGLVIVDTAAAYFEGDDDNINKQMGDYARLLRRFTTLPGEPCVIAACHPVKNASEDRLVPRGGGAFLNELDGNLVCWERDGTVTVHWHEKHRGPDFSPIAFRLLSATAEALKDSEGEPIFTVTAEALSEAGLVEAENETRTDEDAVLAVLLHSGGGSFSSIAQALGWFTRDAAPYKVKVQRVIRRLEKSGHVRVERDGPELTDKGKKAARKCAPEP